MLLAPDKIHQSIARYDVYSIYIIFVFSSPCTIYFSKKLERNLFQILFYVTQIILCVLVSLHMLIQGNTRIFYYCNFFVDESYNFFSFYARNNRKENRVFLLKQNFCPIFIDYFLDAFHYVCELHTCISVIHFFYNYIG